MSGRALASATLTLVLGFASCEKTGDCPGPGQCQPVPDAAEVASGPSPGDVVTPDGGSGEWLPLSACQRCLTPGMCFRFQEVKVTEPSEPEGLPEFLNNIWGPDIAAYRLNMLFCVDEVLARRDGGVTLKVTAGAAWHDLTIEQVLPVEHENRPSWFEFVEGFTTTFEVKVDTDCTFETVGPADLWFHPGPLDHALVCSAGDPSIGLPVDTIPVEKLVAKGKFNDSCTMITAGRLDGCIAGAAACQICSFILAPDYKEWNREPDPGVQDPKPCDASYCNRNCGYASGQVLLPKGSAIWTNFGGFVQGLEVPLGCDTDGDGEDDGYKLAGYWAAGRVPYKRP